MPSQTLKTWPHGAQLLDAHHTRFTLWAPDAHSVSVELKDGRPLQMLPRPEGWFLLDAPCPKGTRYRYCINGEFEVPDPASRAQDGGLVDVGDPYERLDARGAQGGQTAGGLRGQDDHGRHPR